jgi:hypothetical protein
MAITATMAPAGIDHDQKNLHLPDARITATTALAATSTRMVHPLEARISDYGNRDARR